MELFEFEQRGITRPVRVLLFTEWRVIITLLTDIIFVNLL